MRVGRSLDGQAVKATEEADRPRPSIAALLLFYAAYVLTGGLGQGVALVPGISITFWPPAGIFLAALLVNPPSRWPWYIAAGCAAELTCNALWFHNAIPFALIYFAANALESLTAAWLLGRFAGRPFRLESLRDVAMFAVLGACAAPVVAATVIAGTDALLGKHAFLEAWPLVWLGDGTGLLVSTPLALAVVHAWRERQAIPSARLLEALALGTALLVVGSLAFVGVLPTPYMTMPLLIWAGVRFQVNGAAVALALTTLMSALLTWSEAGAYAGQPEALRRQIVAMQTFLAVASVSTLLVSAVAHQLGRALEALRAMNRELEDRVTERTQTLQRERERLAVALRAGEMGVYEWRVGERSVWWSPEMYPVFGVEQGSFVPTVQSFNALIHRDDRADVWRKIEESIVRREVFTHEYRIVRPDGALRWVLNRAHVGLDAAGNVLGITGVAADITERKLAEQALREVDRRKDEFIATLAHELRNPLAPIRNAVEVVKSKVSPVQLDWARSVIERQVGQMARLLDDLLDVGRIGRKTVALRTERVALAAIVESAVETSQPLIDAGRHALRVALPEEPVWIECDRVRLAQVLSNLLNNAAKYTEAGGRIELTAQRVAQQVVVTVRDNGIGISTQALPNVFEMFLQDKPALERSQGGLGIGLSLAKGLVEAMGGSIEAHSEGPGQGSTFTVSLRASAFEEERVSDPLDHGERSEAPASSFLIADDLADSADSLALMLKLLGHQVHTAYDGEQALEIAARHRPEVAVLDLGMPRMNGYEVCKHIRASGWGSEMRLIALSGWGTDEDRRRTLAQGFDVHLVKPVDLAALLEASNVKARGVVG